MSDTMVTAEDGNGFPQPDAPAEPEENDVIFGWKVSTIFCTAVLLIFPIPVTYCVFFVPSDEVALVVDGSPVPRTGFFVMMCAFGTGLIIDFVTWLWTVERTRAQLFMFPVTINFLAFVSYALNYFEYGPILVDFRGRRIILLRFVQWFFTTPTMLYLYSIVSSISRFELAVAMILDSVMIVMGFFASWCHPPLNLISLLVSFSAFFVIVRAINHMMGLAIEDSSPQGSQYSRALVWARLFMTLTWAAIPLVWCVAALDLISVLVEEILYEVLDFSTKAGISCMLLHSSMQTHSERQMEKQNALIQLEREKTILAMEEAARQKEMFFASISHELRTPLNGIIGLAQTVMEGSCGFVNPKMRNRLETIQASGQRLCNLVNDILDASSLMSSSLRLVKDTLAVDELCQPVLEDTKALLKTGVELMQDIAPNLPPIRADAERLKQILRNILGNAAKFTERGSVGLEVALDEEEKNIVFKVSDTGAGIPAEQEKKIWGAFNQGDEGMARRYGGTGLGLTIAKKLVEAHGGTINLERSEVGEGTTFAVRIPCASSLTGAESPLDANSISDPSADLAPNVAAAVGVAAAAAAAAAAGSSSGVNGLVGIGGVGRISPSVSTDGGDSALQAAARESAAAMGDELPTLTGFSDDALGMVPTHVRRRAGFAAGTSVDVHSGVSVLAWEMENMYDLLASDTSTRTADALQKLLAQFHALADSKAIVALPAVDGHLFVGGLGDNVAGGTDALERLLLMAQEMLHAVEKLRGPIQSIRLRFGLHMGPGVECVLGASREEASGRYALGGEAVQGAKELVGKALSNTLLASAGVRELLRDKAEWTTADDAGAEGDLHVAKIGQWRAFEAKRGRQRETVPDPPAAAEGGEKEAGPGEGGGQKRMSPPFALLRARGLQLPQTGKPDDDCWSDVTDDGAKEGKSVSEEDSRDGPARVRGSRKSSATADGARPRDGAKREAGEGILGVGKLAAAAAGGGNEEGVGGSFGRKASVRTTSSASARKEVVTRKSSAGSARGRMMGGSEELDPARLAMVMRVNGLREAEAERAKSEEEPEQQGSMPAQGSGKEGGDGKEEAAGEAAGSEAKKEKEKQEERSEAEARPGGLVAAGVGEEKKATGDELVGASAQDSSQTDPPPKVDVDRPAAVAAGGSGNGAGAGAGAGAEPNGAGGASESVGGTGRSALWPQGRGNEGRLGRRSPRRVRAGATGGSPPGLGRGGGSPLKTTRTPSPETLEGSGGVKEGSAVALASAILREASRESWSEGPTPTTSDMDSRAGSSRAKSPSVKRWEWKVDPGKGSAHLQESDLQKSPMEKAAAAPFVPPMRGRKQRSPERGSHGAGAGDDGGPARREGSFRNKEAAMERRVREMEAKLKQEEEEAVRKREGLRAREEGLKEREKLVQEREQGVEAYRLALMQWEGDRERGGGGGGGGGPRNEHGGGKPMAVQAGAGIAEPSAGPQGRRRVGSMEGGMMAMARSPEAARGQRRRHGSMPDSVMNMGPEMDRFVMGGGMVTPGPEDRRPMSGEQRRASSESWREQGSGVSLAIPEGGGMVSELQEWLLRALAGEGGEAAGGEQEVRVLLRHLGLDHHWHLLEREEVFTLEVLAGMDEAALHALGIRALTTRRRILKAAQALAGALEVARWPQPSATPNGLGVGHGLSHSSWGTPEGSGLSVGERASALRRRSSARSSASPISPARHGQYLGRY